MKDSYWEKWAWLLQSISLTQKRQHHWSVYSNHLKRKQGQHKELLKIMTLCIDTKDNARQGHFYLESVFLSNTISIQTLALSRYAQILIFPSNPISSWILVIQLKLKIDKMWIKDRSAEILGSKLNFNHYNFKRHRLYISKTARSIRDQLI